MREDKVVQKKNQGSAPNNRSNQGRGPRSLARAVQRRGAAQESAEQVHQHAQAGVQGSGSQLPHLAAIQRAFGKHDVSNVQAHVGGKAADAAGAIGARAYATGDKTAFAQSPDLHTAAHEAAHVVQQRGGVQLKGGVGQVGDPYERHADQVADAVVQGKSAEGLLDQMAGDNGSTPVQRAVQRWQRVGTENYRVRRVQVPGAENCDDGEERSFGEDLACGAQEGLDNLAGDINSRDYHLTISTGTQEEWREALTHRDDARVGAFLRSAVYPENSDWETWTRNHLAIVGASDDRVQNILDDIAAGLYRWAGNPSRDPEELELTDEQKVPFTQALYDEDGGIRGIVDNTRFRALFQRYISENQDALIEHSAENATREPDASGLANSTNYEGRISMIGNAGGTILAAIRNYAVRGDQAAEGAAQRESLDAATRRIRRAGHIIRDVADVCAEIEAAQLERMKTLLNVALSAVPIPGLPAGVSFVAHAALERVIEELASETRDHLRDSWADALVEKSQASDLLQEIKNDVNHEIEQLDLPTPGDETALTNTVNSTFE